MSYTTAAVLGVAFAAILDWSVLRTKLLQRKVFWTSYAVMLGFQLVVNGVLTGERLVVYARGAIIGWRVVYAPVEDLLFGFSLVLQTCAWWVWWGRRALRARRSAGSATAARRPSPTATRRSSTR